MYIACCPNILLPNVRLIFVNFTSFLQKRAEALCTVHGEIEAELTDKANTGDFKSHRGDSEIEAALKREHPGFAFGCISPKQAGCIRFLRCPKYDGAGYVSKSHEGEYSYGLLLS
ncbi:hypothetical protein CTI12_AA604800 [Artemisia annua]|uniref:Uncharacterized protein n=1 Tax=Artemisia annua TaxID=35608 RepID=A0A2U1KGU3_ARTAN|nr:hypothetical protein CTI12_AA604800 [Artemisia annua]